MDLNCYITIDGADIKDQEVCITNAEQPLRGLIDRIIKTFKLPTKNSEGIPIQYLLGKVLTDHDEKPMIFDFENEDGREQCLLDYTIQPDDHLQLFALPVLGFGQNNIDADPTPKSSDDFFVYLTIQDTDFENITTKIPNPCDTIRNIVDGILQDFNLQKMDRWGNPCQYLLGKGTANEEEPDILEFEDNYGHEQTILDYNVWPGDHLHLIAVPIAGGGGGGYETFEPSPKKRCRWRSLLRAFKSIKQDVYGSVFAPYEVMPNSHMLVQVYLHLFEETDLVKALAQESIDKVRRRDYIPLQCKLRHGDQVDVQLNIYGKELLKSEKKSLVWQGSFTKCSFDFFFHSDIDISALSCKVLLTINGATIGEMNFVTYVHCHFIKLNSDVRTRQYNKIFISYAHQDENKVEQMARAYRAQGVEYFFDRHYLKPGDVFPLKIQEFIDTADLFILCWSANAAKSEYVELERQRALKRAFPQVKPIENAKLSIYPISIEPRAELPADMKDIYNFEVI